MLQAACQYRQSRASLYKTGELPEREPEYIPWTGEKKLLQVHKFQNTWISVWILNFLLKAATRLSVRVNKNEVFIWGIKWDESMNS